jgi:oligoendopeptidase F
VTAEWDPSLLCPDDHTARAELGELLDGCRRFAARYRGRVATLSPGALAACLDEFGGLRASLMRLTAYATIRTIASLDDQAATDLVSATDAVAADSESELAFLVEEWQELARAHVLQLCAAPELAEHSAVLRVTHDERPARAAPVDEVLLTARDPAAADAWAHLYDLITGRVTVRIGERDLGIDEALGQGRSPDPGVRQAAADQLCRALAERVDELAHCLDTVVADRLLVDELRAVDRPRAERDAENGIDPAHVDAALLAVAESAEVGHRWYAWKAARLGVRRLDFADATAPLGRPAPITLAEARTVVTGAFAALHDDLGAAVADIFTQRRIDWTPRTHKVGNSLCVPAGTAPPYVLVNFTGQHADAVTLGHEIGHAVHYTCAARQGPLACDPPVLIGEVAATFSELLVYDQLLASNADPDFRTAVQALRADTIVSAVFRQAALTRFEDHVYALRARGEVLTAERLNAEWLECLRATYGPAVAIDPSHGVGWALVPHFFRTRYYNYNYVLAWLASLTLHRGYRVDPQTATAGFLDLLAAGATAPASAQLAKLGTVPGNPESWKRGLTELDTIVADASS